MNHPQRTRHFTLPHAWDVSFIFFLTVVAVYFGTNILSPVRFDREKIEIWVQEGHTQVTGIYHYTNHSFLPVSCSMGLPFPVDADHDVPKTFSVAEADGQGFILKGIAARNYRGGTVFRLWFWPWQEKWVRVDYLQGTRISNARYVLLTTRKWGRSLDHGEYILHLSEGLQLASSSYALTQIPRRGQNCYSFDRSDFFPDADWDFSWRSSAVTTGLRIKRQPTMKTVRRIELLLLFLICVALPAYANNPPQPDGLFSILLIFPLATLGARLAGAGPVKSTTARKVATVVVMSVSVVLCMVGTELALLPLITIFFYGIFRGVRIIRRGQGGRGIVIGIAVLAWVVVGVTDYFLSLSYGPTAAVFESSAVGGLRTLANAETEFINSAERQHAGSTAYGTLDDLHSAKLIDVSFVSGQARKGYKFGEIVDPAAEQFLFYAVPAYPYESKLEWWHRVPAGSLLKVLLRIRGEPGTGIRSFAVDETGVIRYDLERPWRTPVTRAEVAGWRPIQ